MKGLEKRGTIFEYRAYAGVMQDKITPRRYRPASGQPLSAGGVAFTRFEHKKETIPAFERTPNENALALERQGEERPKRHGSQTRQVIPVTGCVLPHIAAQLEKMRDQKGKQKLSRSAVIADILTKGVQRHVDMQYGATLEPIIERTIARKIDQATSRTANLALEAFYSAEEARMLTIYTLRLLLGDDDLLAKIVDDVRSAARESLKRYRYAEAPEPQEEYQHNRRQEVPN
jgi:hypothetical protein